MRFTGLLDFEQLISNCDVPQPEDGDCRVQVFIRIHLDPPGHLFQGELRTTWTAPEVHAALEREFPGTPWACRHQRIVAPPGQSSSSVDP